MIKLITFGCRLNTYESEVIKNLLQDRFRDSEVVIFNSCTVTGEAERQLQQAIRKTRREMPNAKIVVVGCAVDTNRNLYEGMADLVLNNKEKLNLASYLPSNPVAEPVSNSTQPQFISGYETRTRAFVKIQDGCNNHCTFCATRLARGKSVSIDSKWVIEQINKLNKYNEIVLTGVDITDYGRGLNEKIDLGLLVKKIMQETNLQRLRLSSIDVAQVNDNLKDILYNEKRVMPHIHLSLQSGDDTILKRMARRHTRQEALNFCNELRLHRPNVGIGADFISGFPTETDDMHRNSYRLIEEANIVFGHIFPYSIRENTPAAYMEQVPIHVRRERGRELRTLSKGLLEKFTIEQLKLPQSVLVETKKIGRTENYISVKLTGKYAVGNIIDYCGTCSL